VDRDNDIMELVEVATSNRERERRGAGSLPVFALKKVE